MLQINPKKIKHIQNKNIPTPLRPKFRGSNETNIYFLSKRRYDQKTKQKIIQKIKFFSFVLIIIYIAYLLSS